MDCGFAACGRAPELRRIVGLPGVHLPAYAGMAEGENLRHEASADTRHPPEPESTSPNSCQVLPSNLSNCICLIGAKSLALVEMVMPGKSIGSFRPWMLAACFITFSRVRLSPHASSTATMACAAV